jgi:hypothetical protein
MKTDSTEVSFSDYGGKPPENYERYFVRPLALPGLLPFLRCPG